MLKFAQKHLEMDLKEGWYEKLQRWDDALAAYEKRVSRCSVILLLLFLSI
jgi:FKBP12-rapamycin complex-associated protein